MLEAVALALGFVALVVAVPLLLIIYATVRKTRWGINFSAIACPKCGTPAPRVRVPTSLEQGLWGGHTCSVCGQDYDKWGRPVAPKTVGH